MSSIGLGLYPLAFAGGAMIAVQALCNAHLARSLGNVLVAGFLSSGLTASLLLLAFVAGRRPGIGWATISSIPAWLLVAGGILGAVIMVCVLTAAPRIGAAALIALLVAGQVVTAAIFDHYGLMGLSVRHVGGMRLLGLALLFAGALMASHP